MRSDGTSVAPVEPRAAVDWGSVAPVLALSTVVLALLFVSSGDVLVVIGALLGIGALVLVWRVPLRWSATAMLFLGLTMESPYEAFAGYLWKTPWEMLGRILLGNLNLVTHIDALKVTGFDLMMFYLLTINWYRRSHGDQRDVEGNLMLARPVVTAAVISLCTILVQMALGQLMGGDLLMSLLQVQKFTTGIVFATVLHAAFRGPKDLGTLGRVLVLAAVFRSLLAVYIFKTVTDGGMPLATSTTHADSVLFAAALMLLVIMYNERAPGADHWTRLLAALIILAGMVYNHRRLVWVQLGLSLVIVAAISPWTLFKRRVARALVLLLPVLALYVAAGWNNAYSSLFKPVGTIRSIVDSKSDSSTLWRDIENLNLVLNISDRPILGMGLGHEYVEFNRLPSVADAYPRYRFVPHNSMVAYFVFIGPFGVAGMLAVLVVSVFLSARTYHRSPNPAVRSAAMLCILMVFLLLNITYGDIGVIMWVTTFLVSTTIMLSGKLAIASGAWPYTPSAAAVRSAEAAMRRREAPEREQPEGWHAP